MTIQPADVHARVVTLEAAARWLAALVVVQIAVKVAIFTWVVGVLRRVDRMLGLVETHGAITDRVVRSEAADVQAQVLRAKTEIKAEVPPAVVEEIKQSLPPSPPATKWRPGDPDRRVEGT